jgi:hypothetical protein
MASKSKPGASYVEDSFGHHIPQPKLNKGEIATFGDCVDAGKLPGGATTVSVNQKTGYPGKE